MVTRAGCLTAIVSGMLAIVGALLVRFGEWPW